MKNILSQVRAVYPSKEGTDYLSTIAAEGLVLLGSVAVLKFSAHLFGASGFGEFTLARRAVTLASYPLLLGLGISIPRYIAHAHASTERKMVEVAHLWAGLLIFSVVIVLFSGGAFWFSGAVAQVVFGAGEYSFFVGPMVVSVAGLYLHTLIYGYFRGRLCIWQANCLQVINVGLLPMAAIWGCGSRPAMALALMGFGWLATSTAAIGIAVGRGNSSGVSFRHVWQNTRTLVRFGLPRVFGEFALFGLFAMPAFLISNRLGVVPAGYFNFATALLQIMTAPVAVAGILLLPNVSRLAAGRNWPEVKRLVSRCTLLLMLLLAPAWVVLEVSLSRLIPWFMGAEFLPAIDMARWLLVGYFPYVIYLIYRNPLDAVAIWPYNTVNLIAALLVVAVVFGAVRSDLPVVHGLTAGLVTLGLLSVVAWRHALKAQMIQKPAFPVDASVPRCKGFNQ